MAVFSVQRSVLPIVTGLLGKKSSFPCILWKKMSKYPSSWTYDVFGR